jgi:DNA-directed RNA polymerase
VFVSFYQDNDVAGLLESQLTAQLPEGATIPEMPPMGALDIREVLFSRYFFA